MPWAKADNSLKDDCDQLAFAELHFHIYKGFVARYSQAAWRGLKQHHPCGVHARLLTTGRTEYYDAAEGG